MARLRYRTVDRLSVTLLVVYLVFVTPLVTAVPVIASISLLHHNWWSAIPLMHYWTAYWWGVVSIILGGGAYLAIRLPLSRLLR